MTEFDTVELALHGMVPPSGYDEAFRDIARQLTQDLPGISYTSEMVGIDVDALRTTGIRGSSGGAGTASRQAYGFDPAQVPKTIRVGQEGVSFSLTATIDAFWHARMSTNVVDWLDFVRFDAKVAVAFPSGSATSLPSSLVDDLVAFGARVANLFHVWNGSVTVAGDALSNLNGFNWYEPYARESVGSYPWAVLVPAPARPRLHLETFRPEVTLTELTGESAGSLFVAAPRPPQVMDDAELRRWRSIFVDAIGPINAAQHNRFLKHGDPRPPGVVPEDWSPV